MCPIKGLSDAGPATGAVPPPRPRPDAYFDELDAPFDKRRARAPPDDDNLLSERWGAFNLAALVLGGTAPLLYGCVKVIKSLDFGGVSRGRTFASNMTDKTREALNLLPGRET